MTFKKILIATDFSRHASHALMRAIQIAEYFQAELTCLHVINQDWLHYFKLADSFDEEVVLKDRIKEASLCYAKELKKSLSQYPVTFITLTGQVSDQINQYITDNSIDLVLMGAHGSYYLNDYILGTNSESIIKYSKIPVQLIKKEPDFSYQRVLVATDFSDASKKAVEMAYRLYPDAEFLILHIADVWYEKHVEDTKKPQQLDYDMHQVLQKKLNLFLEECVIDHSHFLTKFIGGYPADDIANYATAWNAQLVVAGTRGHSLLHYILMGSVTNRLLRINQTDMLIVPS